MNDIPMAASYSAMPRTGTRRLRAIELDSELDRRLLEDALNMRQPGEMLFDVLMPLYVGAATILARKAEEILFEEGPSVLNFKSLVPDTLAILGARRFGLVDYWGDAAGVLECHHVWLRGRPSSGEFGYIICNGKADTRGCYKATIVGDHENISVYTEHIDDDNLYPGMKKQKVYVTEDVAQEVVEFRRRVGTGEI